MADKDHIEMFWGFFSKWPTLVLKKYLLKSTNYSLHTLKTWAIFIKEASCLTLLQWVFVHAKKVQVSEKVIATFGDLLIKN